MPLAGHALQPPSLLRLQLCECERVPACHLATPHAALRWSGSCACVSEGATRRLGQQDDEPVRVRQVGHVRTASYICGVLCLAYVWRALPHSCVACSVSILHYHATCIV
eukprot:365410-Chlamydomonas_euryale.AAC.1